MRLSDAIRMGSLLVERPVAGQLDSCALGMAAKATGCFAHSSAKGDYRIQEHIKKQWPWLENAYALCSMCSNSEFGPHEMRGPAVVWHLFDHHVMNEFYGKMTIEQLADFIASIEPVEAKETNDELRTYEASELCGLSALR